MAKQKSCSFAGFEYVEGTSICKSGKCAKCVKGEWEETKKSCPCS